MSDPRLEQTAEHASGMPLEEPTDRGAIFSRADILIAWTAVIVAFGLLGIFSVVN